MKTTLLIGLMLVATQAAAESPVHPVDLGTLGGGYSLATDINDKDQVVGSSYTSADQMHAFFWDRGRIADLGTLGGPTSRATAINKHGEVVGSSTPKAGSPNEVAFVWRGGALISLGTLPGDRVSQANDINDHGDIVGQSGTDTPRAVIWKHGHIEALPAHAAQLSIANAINNRGQVVGMAVIKTVGARAVLWEDGTMKVLGTLAETPDATSVATGINDRGQIVGRSMTRSGLQHAFVWEDGEFKDLGALTELGISSAADISKNGLIAGYSTNDADVQVGALWRKKGGAVSLGTLDPFGTSFANAVNKKGHVVGGATAGGEDADVHAVIWR